MVFLIMAGSAFAQAPTGALPDWISSTNPAIAGEFMAKQLVSAVPTEPTSVNGTIKIRRGRRIVRNPFKFAVKPGEQTWQAIYETAGVEETPAERVVITYRPNAPCEYLYARAPKPGAPLGEPVRLTSDQATIALADSDFWLSDLGLEFARWPTQRFVKGEMRQHRFCYVLESINPEKAGKGYGRVLSWLDKETGGVLLAEAYDHAGKLLKEFRVSSLKKIEGQWELKEMEMTNEQIRSHTWLQFEYEKKAEQRRSSPE